MQNGDGGLKSLRLADGCVVSFDDAGGIENAFDRLDNQVLALSHRERERLEDDVIVVAVDDDTGETVGFAPNNAPEGGVDPGGFTQAKGAFDATLEEIEVEILTAVGKEAG